MKEIIIKNYDETYQISGIISKNIDFKKILKELFYFIDDELSPKSEKDNNFQYNYDENKQKYNFFLKYRNISNIQRLLYSIEEKKIKCLECTLTSYNFDYCKYFLIDLNKENNPILLNNILLKKDINDNIKEKCSNCYKETKSKIEKFIIEFSKILIIIFEGNNYEKFTLKNNLILSNNNNAYNLICFIEEITNIVYSKDNNNKWYKYLGYKCENVMSIEKINPKILFYQLNEINNMNINIANNLNYINNQNFINNNNMLNLNMISRNNSNMNNGNNSKINLNI